MLLYSNSLLFKHPRVISLRYAYKTSSYRSEYNLRVEKSLTPVSFYNFIPYSDSDITELIESSKSVFEQNNVKGTLIIAPEGYNCQCTISSDKLSKFHDQMKQCLRDNALELNLGPSIRVNETNREPFKKMIVKRKDQIITDGIQQLDKPLSTSIYESNAGLEIDASEWYKEVASHDNNTIIIDVRNDYESNLGMFQNSIPLNTKTYSETWQKLDQVLESKDKNTKILTYCTGGIRCVKVAAYLQENKGFKSVYRLKKGIIGYQQWFEQNKSQIGSEDIFNGVNYLFDGRRIVN